MTRFFSKEGKNLLWAPPGVRPPSSLHSPQQFGNKELPYKCLKAKAPIIDHHRATFHFPMGSSSHMPLFFFQTSIMDLVSTMIPLALCCVWIDTGMRATSGRLQLKLDPEKFVNARIRTSISRSDDLLVLCDKEMTALVSCLCHFILQTQILT